MYDGANGLLQPQSATAHVCDAMPELVRFHSAPLATGRLRLARTLEEPERENQEAIFINVTRDYRYGGTCESYELVSNPYRDSAPDGWTVTRRGASGRVVRVETFDGAAQPEPWGDNTASTGMVTTAYDGSTATVTDQAGKVRARTTTHWGGCCK